MDTQDTFEFYEQLDEDEEIEDYLNLNGRRRRILPRHPKKIPPPAQQFIAGQDDSRRTFEFTYKASLHESGWLLDSLGEFYENNWISDVLRLIKGGKEASVYLCRAGKAAVEAGFLAAKVYRPRQFRNLRKDHLYREGRIDLDAEGRPIHEDGMQKAMRNKSDYGRSLLHTSWIAYEYQALQKLYAAGADVPKPYTMAMNTSFDNAILMAYIGEDGISAPVLNSMDLEGGEARRLFDCVVHNIDLMLACQCIHGDLSAFNILYWEGKITLIDFPQVISPNGNRSAYLIFKRDVSRVCEYFARQGVSVNPRNLAADLWRARGLRLTPRVDPGLLDSEDEDDRDYWRRYQ